MKLNPKPPRPGSLLACFLLKSLAAYTYALPSILSQLQLLLTKLGLFLKGVPSNSTQSANLLLLLD
jgi:hypothetical protein